MNTNPVHIDRYNLEDDHIDQILLNSIWATEVRAHKVPLERYSPRRKAGGTIVLFVDTEHRDDVNKILDELHHPGSDYTARWSFIDSDNRRLFILRLNTPTSPTVTFAGPRNRRVDRALRQASHIAIAPKTGDIIDNNRSITIDNDRSITIDNDRQFWTAQTRRVR